MNERMKRMLRPYNIRGKGKRITVLIKRAYFYLFFARTHYIIIAVHFIRLLIRTAPIIILLLTERSE